MDPWRRGATGVCVVNVKKTCCGFAYRRIDDKRKSYTVHGLTEQGKLCVHYFRFNIAHQKHRRPKGACPAVTIASFGGVKTSVLGQDLCSKPIVDTKSELMSTPTYLLPGVFLNVKSWPGSLHLLCLVARYLGTISVEQPMIIPVRSRGSRNPSSLGPGDRGTIEKYMYTEL